MVQTLAGINSHRIGGPLIVKFLLEGGVAHNRVEGKVLQGCRVLAVVKEDVGRARVQLFLWLLLVDNKLRSFLSDHDYLLNKPYKRDNNIDYGDHFHI